MNKKTEEADKKEDEQYKYAIQHAPSSLDRQLLVWARSCMKQLKKEGNNPTTIQDILMRLTDLSAADYMLNAEKSHVALDSTSLFNKQLQKIRDIMKSFSKE